MKILFVCKHNRFRSIVAEAIFNFLNKNKKIKVKSAGIKIDLLRPYIEPVVIKIMKEKGYRIKGKPRKLTKEIIKNFDLIVIVSENLFSDDTQKSDKIKKISDVADDIDKKLFSGFEGKIIRWKIQDADALDVKKIKRIVNEIEIKVKELISSLK